MAIVRVIVSHFEVYTGRLPKFLSIAPLTIGEPSNPIVSLYPLPRCLNTVGKQGFVLDASLSGHLIATLAFNEVNCPAL